MLVKCCMGRAGQERSNTSDQTEVVNRKWSNGSGQTEVVKRKWSTGSGLTEVVKRIPSPALPLSSRLPIHLPLSCLRVGTESGRGSAGGASEHERGACAGGRAGRDRPVRCAVRAIAPPLQRAGCTGPSGRALAAGCLTTGQNASRASPSQMPTTGQNGSTGQDGCTGQNGSTGRNASRASPSGPQPAAAAGLRRARVGGGPGSRTGRTGRARVGR